MNLVKIASNITAKFLGLPNFIKEDQVIAVKGGYYTNSGLDMGQHEETRSATCFVYLDGDEIKGYASWYIDSGKTSDKGEDKKTFSNIDTCFSNGIRRIEEWALGILRQVRVDKESKKDWEGTQDNRRRALSKFIQVAFDKWNDQKRKPAIPAQQPAQNAIPSVTVQEQHQFKEMRDKLEASVKDLFKIYSLCSESSYHLKGDKQAASQLLWEASGELVKARTAIERAIGVLE